MADTATFSAAMKTKFIGPIRDNLHRGKVLLFGDSDANPEDFKGILASAEGIDHVGNEFRIPMKAKRNQAVGFRHENELLMTPGSSEYTYLSEPLRFSYGLFNITGQLLKASESSEGAFRSAFKAEMEDLVLSNKLDFNRAAYGNGTGIMATVRNNEAAGQTVLDVDTTINFRGGEVIQPVVVATGATIANENAFEVTSVDRVNRTITVAPALATGLTATTHGFVRASASTTAAAPNNSYGREIEGLQSLVAATGTLHGLNPTTYSFWKSYVATGVGAINDSVLRDAKDGVMFESGFDLESGNDFAIITTRGIRRRYADTLTALKRFNDAQSVKLHGGFTALMFDENPLFVDDQCPVGNVFGLSLNKLFWSQASDWEWMEKDGDVLKWDTSRDRYLAVLYKYCQLGTTARNGHFRLSGVTDDVR
jgi:hypothetical protein